MRRSYPQYRPRTNTMKVIVDGVEEERNISYSEKVWNGYTNLAIPQTKVGEHIEWVAGSRTPLITSMT